MTTQISEMGEFGLIRRLTDQFPIHHPDRMPVAVGDDAAVITLPEGEQLLVSSDMLLEGVHFDLTYTPLKHLGYKAVVVNLSDICAMNGTPRQITVSMGISAKFSVEALKELYAGIRLACETYHVDLAGGDTCASKNGLSLSITCIGTVETGRAVLRSTARVHDLICVTGDLGAAYMGLQLLDRENRVFRSAPSDQFEPNFDGYEYLIERQLKPEAQIGLKRVLEDYALTPTSMIDISDGLSSELLHLAQDAHAGVRVYEERLPIAAQTIALCNEMHIAPITAAFNGGEDYELLFTVPLTQAGVVSQVPGISVIGHVTEAAEGCRWVSPDHAEHELIAQGWNAAEHLS